MCRVVFIAAAAGRFRKPVAILERARVQQRDRYARLLQLHPRPGRAAENKHRTSASRASLACFPCLLACCLAVMVDVVELVIGVSGVFLYSRCSQPQVYLRACRRRHFFGVTLAPLFRSFQSARSSKDCVNTGSSTMCRHCRTIEPATTVSSRHIISMIVHTPPLEKIKRNDTYDENKISHTVVVVVVKYKKHTSSTGVS